jgi:uncharacterized short protein YbdD (DUF466 family)
MLDEPRCASLRAAQRGWDAYVPEMRHRLPEKQIGVKREFLQKLLKEVKMRNGSGGR